MNPSFSEEDVRHWELSLNHSLFHFLVRPKSNTLYIHLWVSILRTNFWKWKFYIHFDIRDLVLDLPSSARRLCVYKKQPPDEDMYCSLDPQMTSFLLGTAKEKQCLNWKVLSSWTDWSIGKLLMPHFLLFSQNLRQSSFQPRLSNWSSSKRQACDYSSVYLTRDFQAKRRRCRL